MRRPAAAHELRASERVRSLYSLLPSGHWGTLKRWIDKECICRQKLATTPRRFWYDTYLRPKSAGDWLSLATSAAIVVGGTAMFIDGDEDFIGEVSDFGEMALPALGYTVPVLYGDVWGFGQFVVQYGLTMSINRSIKEGVGRWRPDSESNDSYPSAHTASAFSGAAFLHSRYGAKWGVPAYLMATLTGLTRVRLERHFLDDVIAGAGVAMVTNWFMSSLLGSECRELMRFGCPPKWRIEFAFGAVLQSQNEIQSPRDTGTPFDLSDWDGGDDAWPTARLTFTHYINERHELALRIDPFEIRDTVTPAAPLTFNDTTFAAGSDLGARWLAHEYKLRWRYAFLPRKSCFDLRAGVTAVLADYQVELINAATSSKLSETGVMAMPHLYAAWEFVRNLEVSLRAEGLPGVDFAGIDLEGVLRWNISPGWDVGVGYRFNRTRIDVSEIVNDADTNEVFLAFGRSF